MSFDHGFYSTSLDTKLSALAEINADATRTPGGIPRDDLFTAISDGAGGTNRLDIDTHDGYRRSVMVLASEKGRTHYASIVHDDGFILRVLWASYPFRGDTAEDSVHALADVANDIDEFEQTEDFDRKVASGPWRAA